MEMETGGHRTTTQAGLRSGASPGSPQGGSAGPSHHTPAPRSHRVWADLGPQSPRTLAVEAGPQAAPPGAGQ